MKRIITISRQFGSGGREIGKEVARRLAIPYYDKEILAEAAKESGLSQAFLEACDQKKPNSLLYSLVMGGQFWQGDKTLPPEQLAAEAQRTVILQVAQKGPCVIVGRCADAVLGDRPDVLRVFLHGAVADRVRHIQARDGLEEKEALATMKKMDQVRRAYYNYYTDKSWGAAENYDLCLNVSKLGAKGAAELILMG